MSADSLKEIKDAYKDYLEVLTRLRAIDPSRKYKNIVGDIGEMYACAYYRLKKANKTGCDATTDSGQGVEIKTRTNAKGKVEIKKDASAELLLVLLLKDSGDFEEVYFGPISLFFQHATYSKRENDYQLGIAALRKLRPSQIVQSRSSRT